MLSENWIKNLATARLDHGCWRTRNPEEVQRQIERDVVNTLPILYNNAKDACEVFNQYAPRATALRLLPINSPGQEQMEGFILLYGHVQLKLVYDQFRLVGRIVSVSAFKGASKVCVAFHPCFDALGSLYWKTENGVLMDHELMIETLLETIVREAAAQQES